MPKPSNFSGRDGSPTSDRQAPAAAVSGANLAAEAKRPQRVFSAAGSPTSDRQTPAAVASGANLAAKAKRPQRVFSAAGSPTSNPQAPAAVASGGSLETVAKRFRRVFTAADKLRIVKEADSCLALGPRGSLEALLRREGIYSSLLSSWRMQLGAHGAAGLAARKAGRKPRLTEAERRNVELTKRNAQLERKLHVASVLIGLQKKAHELLGLALPESGGET